MLAGPTDLPDDALALALRDWDVEAVSLEYLAVGFGSHHWLVADRVGPSWFLTVDDLREGLHAQGDTLDGAAERLARALGLARRLADEGFSFVLAPVPATDGAVVRRIGRHFGLALYPYIEGFSPGWENLTEDHRHEVTDLLCRLHRVRPASPGVRGLDIANRHGLEAALGDLDGRWRADRTPNPPDSSCGSMPRRFAWRSPGTTPWRDGPPPSATEWSSPTANPMAATCSSHRTGCT